MKYKAAGKTLELLDKVNPVQKKYKQKPNFDLINFTWAKAAGYFWLTVVVSGDLEGRDVPVYQISGKPVELERVNTLVYRYKDPQDEVIEIRFFETSVNITEIEKKTKQLAIETKPYIYYLTSTIYPINLIEEATTFSKETSGRMLTSDDLSLRSSAMDSCLPDIRDVTWSCPVVLREYFYFNNQENNTDSLVHTFKDVSGTLREILVQLPLKQEELNLSIKLITGTLRTLLIDYLFYKVESLDVTFKNVEGGFVQLGTNYFETLLKAESEDYDYTDTDTGYTEVRNEIKNRNVTNDPSTFKTDYTTSLINFENDSVDGVSSTLWSNVGSSTFTTTNKLYGRKSLETKTIGEGFATNSSIITNGTEPFTIEFYALVSKTQPSTYNYLPLFTNDYAAADQGIYKHKTENTLVYYRSNSSNVVDTKGNIKINPNEINKITASYDGACLRFFVNDELDFMQGTLSPFVIQSTWAFFKSYNSGIINSLNGLLDNVHIQKGIATKVRETDPYEKNLVVDLAFDGENNSTKIVDNGTLKSNWTVNGTVKLSTDQKFNGFSSFYSATDGYISTDCELNLSKSFTISFEYIRKNISSAAIIDYRSGVGAFDGLLLTHPSADNNKMNLYLGGTGVDWKVNLITNSDISLDKIYKIDLVCSDNTVSIFINGILDRIQSFNEDIIVNSPSTRKLTINRNVSGGGGGLISYIKNFKIYKDIAIIPESRVGKIQLDFENNVIDKYNNSTWTASSLSMNKVNAVKGLAANFTSSSTLVSTANNDLNYGSGDFEYSVDYKATDYGSSYGSGIFSNGYSSNQDSAVRFALVHSSTNGAIYAINGLDATSSNGISLLNNYYNLVQGRVGGVFYGVTNGVLTGLSPYTRTDETNYNYNSKTSIGMANYYNSLRTVGYIDNFKSQKGYTNTEVITRPVIDLPLSTGNINKGLGASDMFTSVGNPQHSVIDGVRCLKFESGKYLNATVANQIKTNNLGTKSDFYLEFDFYPTSGRYHVMFSNGTTSVGNRTLVAVSLGDATTVDSEGVPKPYCLYLYYLDKGLMTDNSYVIDAWNNVKIFRIGDNLTVSLNNVPKVFVGTFALDFSYLGTYLGKQTYGNTSDFQGYLANFKLFLGTSKKPVVYNSNEALHLDFKPTRKSYLFKDNYNKHVIHSSGITERSYLNSQYCCEFNGSTQYLELGQSGSLNFGLEDFVLKIKFSYSTDRNYATLLSGGSTSGATENNSIMIVTDKGSSTLVESNAMHMKASGVVIFNTGLNTIQPNVINTMLVTRTAGVFSLYLNGKLIAVNADQLTTLFNLNFSNKTYIGKVGHNTVEHLKGAIYELDIISGNSDLALVNFEPLSDGFEFNENLISNNGLYTLVPTSGTPTYTTISNEPNKQVALNISSVTVPSLTTTDAIANFGVSDFEITFVYNTSTRGTFLSTNHTSLLDGCIYIQTSSATDLSFVKRKGTSSVTYTSTSSVFYNTWIKLKIIRRSDIIFTYINDVLVYTSPVDLTEEFNFGVTGATRIGATSWLLSGSNLTGMINQASLVKRTESTLKSALMCHLPLKTESVLDLGLGTYGIWSNASTVEPSIVRDTECCRFISSNKYMNQSLKLGNLFQITFKFTAESLPATGKRLFVIGNSNLISGNFKCYIQQSDSRFYLETYGGTVISVPINVTEWNNINISLNKSIITLNVNGITATTLTTANGFNTNVALYLGHIVDSNVDSSTPMYMTDFRIYSGNSPVDLDTINYKILHLKFHRNESKDYVIKDSAERVVVGPVNVGSEDLVNVGGINCVSLGVNQFITLKTDSNFDFATTDNTVMFKILPTDKTTDNQVVLANSIGGINATRFLLDGTTSRLRLVHRDVEIFSLQVNMGVWNTISMKTLSNELEVNINGTKSNYTLPSGINYGHGGYTYIGYSVISNSLNFKGYVADVRFYKGTTNDDIIKVDNESDINIVLIKNPPRIVLYNVEDNLQDTTKTEWVQSFQNYKASYREFGEENVGLYFDGVSGLKSSNRQYKMGLSPFTWECDIQLNYLPTSTSYPAPIISYGSETTYAEWFSLQVTSTGILRFGHRSASNYLSSPANMIKPNIKYRVAVTRTEDFILRLFINGIKVAEGSFNNSLDTGVYSYPHRQGIINIGRLGDFSNNTSSNFGLKGFIDNVYLNRGFCKYTEDYTVNPITLTRPIKQALISPLPTQVGSTLTEIVDQSSGLTWSANNVNVIASNGVTPQVLSFNTLTSRLMSDISENHEILSSDFTLDLIFTPNQIATDCVLVDMRQNSSSFSGLVITQPAGSPASLTIQTGGRAVTAYDYTYNTGANTIASGVQYHLRLTRSLGELFIFLDGVLKTTLNIGTTEIHTPSKIILGNNDASLKNFNGYISQFRLIKDKAVTITAFNKITKALV